MFTSWLFSGRIYRLLSPFLHYICICGFRVCMLTPHSCVSVIILWSAVLLPEERRPTKALCSFLGVVGIEVAPIPRGLWMPDRMGRCQLPQPSGSFVEEKRPTYFRRCFWNPPDPSSGSSFCSRIKPITARHKLQSRRNKRYPPTAIEQQEKLTPEMGIGNKYYKKHKTTYLLHPHINKTNRTRGKRNWKIGKWDIMSTVFRCASDHPRYRRLRLE